MPKRSIAEMFWPKVDKCGPDECWEWQGATTSRGVGTQDVRYGIFWVTGRRVRAHRLAYQLHYGVTPLPSVVVCHSCDNTLCCNPDHLMLSSQRANMKDAARKGRIRRGPSHSDDEVRAVHRLRGEGLSMPVIAEQSGLCISTVQDWLCGRRRSSIYEEFHGVQMLEAA